MTRILRSALVVWILVVACSFASAAPQKYWTSLSGSAEEPPNASPGTGIAYVTFDPVAHTLLVDVTFQDLIGTVTASHIHGPTTNPFTGTASVMTTTPTFTGFPSGVTSGSYLHLFDTLDAGTYRPGFLTLNGGSIPAAETALFNAIVDGKAYFNIHTTRFPAGEIRGFLVPVPEPAFVSFAVCAGLFGLTALRRRRLA